MNNNQMWICLLFVIIQNIYGFRCRSGNQQINDEIEKVMLKCKRHNSELRRDDSSSSSEEESSEENSSSDGGLFTREFFSNSKKELQNNSKNSWNRSSLISMNNNPISYKKPSGTSSTYMSSSNDSKMRENQRRMSNGNRDNGSIMSGMQRDNQRPSDDNYREKYCTSQCFFDEMNCVNKDGFPERIPVTRIMLRGIQDPVLGDFLEESILECFQFLNFQMNYDKCTYSDNLLNCLADKGRERCEDWDN